jgi:hypothetical protein
MNCTYHPTLLTEHYYKLYIEIQNQKYRDPNTTLAPIVRWSQYLNLDSWGEVLSGSHRPITGL